MRNGLGPALVAGTALLGDVLELHPAQVAEEAVGERRMVVPVLGGKGAFQIVAEIADVDIQQRIAIVIERGGRAAHQAEAAQARHRGDILEAATSQVAV